MSLFSRLSAAYRAFVQSLPPVSSSTSVQANPAGTWVLDGTAIMTDGSASSIYVNHSLKRVEGRRHGKTVALDYEAYTRRNRYIPIEPMPYGF